MTEATTEEILDHCDKWRPFSWFKVWWHCLLRVMGPEDHRMCWVKIRFHEKHKLPRWEKWVRQMKRHYCSCGYNS